MLNKPEKIPLSIQIHMDHIAYIQFFHISFIRRSIQFFHKKGPEFRTIFNTGPILFPFGTNPFYPYLVKFFPCLYCTVGKAVFFQSNIIR